MEKSKSKTKSSMADDSTYHKPEKELSSVVLHAGELADITILRDYLQMTKLTGELNVNEIDSRGLTPLHFAVSTKKVDVVRTLVEYGANVNQRDGLGFTPLMLATGRYGDVHVASYLIEKARASVHITTDSGVSALHGAAIKGNLDCITLLLKHGADARCSDDDEHTPIDVARDDITKQLLQKAVRHLDLKEDNKDSFCEQCGAAETELKRCGRCFVTKYCSRACQKLHWKAGHRTTCPGSVVGRSSSAASAGKGFTALFNMNSLRMHTYDMSNTQLSTDNCQKKKFIVKIQIPLSAGPGLKESSKAEMMCYNEDRSMTGYISSNEKGYDALRKSIADQGFMGVKAFFWAEIDVEANDGSFKVFHGRLAPYQTW